MNPILSSGLNSFQHFWPEFIAIVHILIALGTSIHVVLTKEDTKAGTAWVGLAWLSPFLGAFLYYVLGINRIRRKAISVRDGVTGSSLKYPEASVSAEVTDKDFMGLTALGEKLSGRNLTAGNHVVPLINGDEAYPLMLESIQKATKSIALSSYIFDFDRAGEKFVKVLEEVQKRGVSIRVLIDATGARYSFPSITKPLKKLGINHALFMPNLSLKKIGTMNLRSHRKLLVIDGKVGFTGGMNIREGNVISSAPKHPIQDLHFHCLGPVVRHIQEAFIEDWAFTTGELLKGETWLPETSHEGEMLARGILDGPDENYEKILFLLLGAFSRSQKSIRILTPYFLPDQTTIRMLSVAAMRGIEVEIVLPEQNNILLVKWATMPTVAPLLRHGVRIYLSKPPFDHSKLVVIDDSWVLFGSANLDSRSLELNFEFNIECFSQSFASQMTHIFQDKKRNARLLSLSELQNRPLHIKIRDGSVRLLAPYL